MGRQVQTLLVCPGNLARREMQGNARVSRQVDNDWAGSELGREEREGREECGSAISHPSNPGARAAATAATAAKSFLAHIGERLKRAQNTATPVQAWPKHLVSAVSTLFDTFDAFHGRVPQRARGARRQLLLAETNWRLAAACDLRSGPSCRGAPIHPTPTLIQPPPPFCKQRQRMRDICKIAAP